jgi:translation initiation factor 1A
MLGNGRLEARAFDDAGTQRLVHIRGKLRKKVWINNGDIILLSLREFQDEKGDVILKYATPPPHPAPPFVSTYGKQMHTYVTFWGGADHYPRYTAEEARSLKAYGELPAHAKINETDLIGETYEDAGFEFDEDREGDSDSSDKEVDVDNI